MSRRAHRRSLDAATATQVLFVCTANIARSAVLEALFRQFLAAHGAPSTVEVSSAGTHATTGTAPSREALSFAASRQLEIAAHTARHLDQAMLTRPAVVLTATRAHKQHVLAMQPSLLSRTFTVREYARLAAAAESGILREADLGERITALTAYASAHRSAHTSAADADDIVDPYRREPSVVAQFEDQVSRASDAIFAALADAADGDAGRLGPGGTEAA